ncbi:hypothetical protein FQN49_008623, partial [Arthroderma sp. PD_2]
QVANNINDVEGFGDLPGELLHRLSQILSKRRALTPRTLELFLRSDVNTIDIYDAAKLEEEDFQKVFALMPFLEQVNFRCAGQLKDSVLEYVMSRESHIKHLTLDASNLLSEECWRQFFKTCGSRLETIKLSNLDCAFNDESVEVMVTHCPNLRRLKLTDCWKLTYGCLESIAKLKNLQHLSLDMRHYESKSFEEDVERINSLLKARCSNLQTLSLEHFKPFDNSSLAILHDQARKLSKLRLSHNENCNDGAFASLFTDWANPPILSIDLSSNRLIDPMMPAGEDSPAHGGTPTGLAAAGFKALMAHSGSKIQKLNISSCRHVGHEPFGEVFGDGKVYEYLREVDVSFHTEMDDYLMGCMFRSCPALSKVIAFACFNVVDVKPPANVALIGGLNAHTM